MKMVRVPPKAPGLYLLQRKVDNAPICVIIEKDDANNLFCMIDNKKVFVRNINAAAKWSQILTIIPKQI
jgi:hypothetical protein